MNTTDRTHAVIACLHEIADTARMRRDITWDCHIAARALEVARDDVAAARLYPWTSVDEMQAGGLWRFLRGKGPAPATADDRAVACRVAARFAEVALARAMLIADDGADWLWSAAGRLSGLAEADDASVAARVQVGDTIDAADVPPRTLVECPNKDLVIRMPSGTGWTLGADSWPGFWTWQGGMDDAPKVRVMATDIPAEECIAVTCMTPSDAREWLAKRVATEPVS